MFEEIRKIEGGKLPWRMFYPRFKERWTTERDNLMLGHRTVGSLAKEHGTPIYLYDSEIALGRLRLLLETFSPFEILYFLKANPNPDLALSLAVYTNSISMQSIGEYETAFQSPIGGINFCGPGKTFEDYSKVVIDPRVHNIDIESADELGALENACKITGTSWQGATIRINTLYTPREATEHMAGGPSQFGIDEERVAEEIKNIPLKRVQLQGIHVHSASGVIDPDALVDQFKYTANCAKKISQALHFPLKVINFGGGIGIPYSSEEHHMDFFTLGKRIHNALIAIFPDEKTRPRFQIEPGKLLVGECGIFVSQILDIQKRRIADDQEVPTILIDGNAAFSRPAMSWAQPHPVSIATKQGIKPTEKYFIAGRHGGEEETDGIFSLQFGELPNPQVGELLVFNNAGAYGATMSFPITTDSGSPPLEVTYVKGDYKVHKLDLY